jgi:hypothetical protein
VLEDVVEEAAGLGAAGEIRQDQRLARLGIPRFCRRGTDRTAAPETGGAPGCAE